MGFKCFRPYWYLYLPPFVTSGNFAFSHRLFLCVLYNSHNKNTYRFLKTAVTASFLWRRLCSMWCRSSNFKHNYINASLQNKFVCFLKIKQLHVLRHPLGFAYLKVELLARSNPASETSCHGQPDQAFPWFFWAPEQTLNLHPKSKFHCLLLMQPS